jgi:hypothetical protein
MASSYYTPRNETETCGGLLARLSEKSKPRQHTYIYPGQLYSKYIVITQ